MSYSHATRRVLGYRILNVIKWKQKGDIGGEEETELGKRK